MNLSRITSAFVRFASGLRRKHEIASEHLLVPEGPRLHLGCGQVHLEGWINVDRERTKFTDQVFDFKNIREAYTDSSVAAVMMIHSLSYLRFWEAQIFFRDVYAILKPSGEFILELPDLAKCAQSLLKAIPVDAGTYLEAVRAVYAFDMDEHRQRNSYAPYHFGWSAWHLSNELKEAGFKNVRILDPLTHGPRLWRDTRIHATK